VIRSSMQDKDARFHAFAGFTLIEVMVALAIVALALVATSRSLGVTVNNQSYLETKVIATWVAEDAITEKQLSSSAGSSNLVKKHLMGREFEVVFSTEPTFIPQIFKLTVEVREVGDESPSATLSTVVGSPS